MAARSALAMGDDGLPQRYQSGDFLPAAFGGTGRTDGGNLLPPGCVDFFATSTPPTGYLKANGAAVSRTIYAALYAAIGTAFGTGDGSTTFNLPDLRGQFLRAWADNGSLDSGRQNGSLQAQNLPNFQLRMPMGFDYTSKVYGWFNASQQPIFGSQVQTGTSSAEVVANGYTSGRSINVAYTDSVPLNISGENRPPNVALLACIKY